MKVLIDTDVCLDLLTLREPHGRPAQQLFAAVERRRARGFVTATSFIHIHYFLRKFAGAAVGAALADFRALVDVLPVTERAVDLALEARWPDFEDAMQEQAARLGGMDAIVTRNGRDYRRSRVRVLAPAEALRALRKGS